MTHRALILLTATIALVLAGCSRGGPAPTPTATPTASASPAATASPAASTATAEPTPTTLLPVATGQAIPPIVSQVVTAVATKQTATLAPLVAYQQVGCTTAQGAGGPPKCRPGDAAGTVYRVFPTGTCEGEWATDAVGALAQVSVGLGDLFAAAKVTPPANDPEPYWPKGEAVVIFAGINGAPGGYLVLSGSQIVRAHRVCGAAIGGGIEGLLKSLNATQFYIAPR